MYPLQGLLAKARVRGRNHLEKAPLMEGVPPFGSHFPTKKTSKQLYTPPKTHRCFHEKNRGLTARLPVLSFLKWLSPFCLGGHSLKTPGGKGWESERLKRAFQFGKKKAKNWEIVFFESDTVLIAN